MKEVTLQTFLTPKQIATALGVFRAAMGQLTQRMLYVQREQARATEEAIAAGKDPATVPLITMSAQEINQIMSAIEKAHHIAALYLPLAPPPEPTMKSEDGRVIDVGANEADAAFARRLDTMTPEEFRAVFEKHLALAPGGIE